MKKLAPIFLLVLYGCAALQFTRFYIKSTVSYLHMPDYLTGHERLPFQQRIFPVLVMRPLGQTAWVQHLEQARSSAMGDQWPAYLLSLLALVVAAGYTQALYERLTRRGLLRVLVFPVFLFAMLWTFAIHLEANFFYPYDLPSVAFFTAGIFYIVRRQFAPLLLIMVLGTSNRETTLFLVGIYVVDALSRGAGHAAAAESLRVKLRRVPWLRAGLLLLLWIAVRAVLVHRFAGNNRTESYLRVWDNLHQLRPRLMPALLNICGYLLPLVLLFARGLRPRFFRNYLWVLPAWFCVMFCAGVLVETRIYGEWCGYAAVAAVLLLERSAERRILRNPVWRARKRQLRAQPVHPALATGASAQDGVRRAA